MKLKCPACGAPIPADDINITTMTALCRACDSVFKFEAGGLARKIKAPQQINTYDDAPLHFAFKWDWRTEPLIGLLGLTVCFVMAFIMFSGVWGSTAALLGLAIMLLPLYVFLSLWRNRTHYKVEGDRLEVQTRPLPFLFYGSHSLRLDDLTRITAERVMTTPSVTATDGFYNVYAHTADGPRVRIARLVNGQHAQYIAQELQGYLEAWQTHADALFDEDEDAGADMVEDKIKRLDRRR